MESGLGSATSPPIPNALVSSTTSSSTSILTNYSLISSLIAFVIAQLTKFLITWYKERRCDAKLLIAAGGMPSSHSSTVTALASAVGFQDGFGGTSFATAVVLALVVMHDALGVRLHAGRQAKVLNQIVFELPDEHPLSDSRPLRELLGHTPLQVLAGGVLGIVVTVAVYFIKIAVIQTDAYTNFTLKFFFS